MRRGAELWKEAFAIAEATAEGGPDQGREGGGDTPCRTLTSFKVPIECHLCQIALSDICHDPPRSGRWGLCEAWHAVVSLVPAITDPDFPLLLPTSRPSICYPHPLG